MEGFPIGLARRDLQNVVAGSVGGVRDAAAAIALPFDLGEDTRDAASGHSVHDAAFDLSRERMAPWASAVTFRAVAIALYHEARHHSLDYGMRNGAFHPSGESGRRVAG